jgi:hypothetical protein
VDEPVLDRMISAALNRAQDQFTLLLEVRIVMYCCDPYSSAIGCSLLGWYNDRSTASLP